MKRDRWTEADIIGLPEGEHDGFERKSGRLLGDPENFLNAFSKVLSAFANSGGGSLVLGVENDGVISGIEPLRGRTPTREWLEQKIPNLLEHPLSDFRVHVVERAIPSQIPEDKDVIVIDIGDSALAPHQDKRSKKYYHRVGGHSTPASHFYLELLRSRLTNPSLDFRLTALRINSADKHSPGPFIQCELGLEVENIGQVAAYKWGLRVRNIGHPLLERDITFADRIMFDRSKFPIRRGGMSSIALDSTILPGDYHTVKQVFGLQLLSPEQIRTQLQEILGPLRIGFALATETSPGEIKQVSINDVLDIDQTVQAVEQFLA